jgi:large subunit ribosomal protein L22
MQTVRAYQKYIRQTPRKLRLVADVVRNLGLDEALEQLTFMNKRAAAEIGKVLKQAKANAGQVSLDEKSLKINSNVIEEGPTYKRWQPVSRGRAHPILKRSSHIKVILEGDKGATAKARTSKEEPKKETK